MNCLEVIDTFPAFQDFWADAQGKSLDEQIELWAEKYLSDWPELLELQVQDYYEQNLDWKQIARERVFPYLKERFPDMQEARAHLLKAGPNVFFKARQFLNCDTTMYFVIHVGIGCGAGWVTKFQNKYSILFGLENIAECGWSSPEAIDGLVAHETGHLVHFCMREQNNRQAGSGPWWQLYTEGFAQYCEDLLNTSSHQESQDEEWMTWCRQNKKRLASGFMMAADENQPVNPFFGSWFEIEGHSETGYFLGYEIVRTLAKEMNFQDIALLDDFEKCSREILEEMIAKE